MMRSALAATLCLVLTGMPADATTVQVPDGFTVEYSEPPNPNHGFNMKLGGSRMLYVGADYDATETGSATAAPEEILSFHGCGRIAMIRHTRFVGLPAASAEINLGARQAIRFVAFRSDPSATVIYHFDLDTDHSHASRDRAALQTVMRGFALKPLP